MSEDTSAPTVEQTEATPEAKAPKPTETVDFWKQKAREQEKRAKDNADAASRLAEIEESQKSETQRLADAAAEADRRATAATTEALRWRIAAKHGITDEDAETFLTAGDEESLTRQAQRLAALSTTASEAEQRAPGPRPDLSQGAQSPGSLAGSPADDFARFMSQPTNG